jgi:hypothetical protein
MTIEIQPNGSGPYHAIAASPFPIVCQVSQTDPSRTVISGAGASFTTAGALTDFTVTLFDSGGNQRTSGGDQLAVQIVPTVGTLTPGSVSGIEVFDQLDGTYTVRYEVVDSSTAYSISVTVNTDVGHTKQSRLTVVSNWTSPELSTFTSVSLGWPTSAASTVVHLAQAYSFATHLTDAFGNPITERALTLITEIEGQGRSLYSTASLAALSTGTYQTSFTVPTSADRSISLCGTYTLLQYLVESGGLTASYYPNKWFSPYSQPYLTQIDPVINFHWELGADLIPNVASEYVSIEWVGYLMPQETGQHYFFVEADDGVRVYVDNQLLIDQMADVGDGEVHRIASQ